MFAIGPEEDEPLQRHIAHAHAATPEVVVVTEAEKRDADREDVEALRFHLASGDRPTRDLSLALLARQDVPVELLAEWFGLPSETVRERLEVVERSLRARRARGGRSPVETGSGADTEHGADDGTDGHERQRESTAEQ